MTKIIIKDIMIFIGTLGLMMLMAAGLDRATTAYGQNIPQNEDQKRFWTAQYCDIDYEDKPQNATIVGFCDTAMQYMSFFCIDSVLVMTGNDSCDYLNGIGDTVDKYTDTRNITTIDELTYEMPKSEALNFQKPTETDFQNAYQRLYQIDAGKSNFELMISPDKPLIEREPLESARLVEGEGE
jgi:hypothetical protein